jgi:hypothetical protein
MVNAIGRRKSPIPRLPVGGRHPTKRKLPTARANNASEASTLVHEFTLRTRNSFEPWRRSLNDAIKVMGGGSEAYLPNDSRQIQSYWYVLMHLLEVYARKGQLFGKREGDRSFTEPFVSRDETARELRSYFGNSTTRRYLWDLETKGLLKVDGRGSKAMISLSWPIISALRDTMEKWLEEFRKLDKLYETATANDVRKNARPITKPKRR